MKVSKIHDERELYEAVSEYSSKIWQWGAHMDDDFEMQPTPDELIDMLIKRIEWVKAHKKAVDEYCRKRSGPTWVRVIDGTGKQAG